MLVLFYFLMAVATITMVVGLVMGIRLKRVASGGTIGKIVNTLLGLILLFLAGYLAAPLMPFLSPEVGLVLTAVVFFFGAAFVVLVLWLITRLVRKVDDALKME